MQYKHNDKKNDEGVGIENHDYKFLRLILFKAVVCL